MYIGEEDLLPVIVCVGRSRNPHLPEEYNKIALLFFEYEPGKVTFAILEELVVLSVIYNYNNNDNEIGVFTFFKKDLDNGEHSASDILLIKPLIGSLGLNHVTIPDIVYPQKISVRGAKVTKIWLEYAARNKSAKTEKKTNNIKIQRK